LDEEALHLMQSTVIILLKGLCRNLHLFLKNKALLSIGFSFLGLGYKNYSNFKYNKQNLKMRPHCGIFFQIQPIFAVRLVYFVFRLKSM
jgi:hypothetical protein